MDANLGGDSGRARGALPELNVTPLVDVALVVLIIFMVIAPLAIERMRVHLPSPAAGQGGSTDDRRPLSVRVRAGGALLIDDEVIDASALESEIARRIATTDGTVALRADASVPYGEVVRAADRCRRGGAAVVALPTKAGQ